MRKEKLDEAKSALEKALQKALSNFYSATRSMPEAESYGEAAGILDAEMSGVNMRLQELRRGRE